MIGLLRHLLDPAYLYAQNSAPARDWSLAYSLWAVLLLTSIVYSAQRLRRVVVFGSFGAVSATYTARITFLAGWAGLLLLLLRPLVVGAFSARVWSLSATGLVALSMLTPALAQGRLSAPARALGRALACQLSPADPPLPIGWRVILVGLHVSGLAVLALYGRAGAGPAIVALFCLAVMAWVGGRTDRRGISLRPEVLTALLPAYGAALLAGLLLPELGIQPELYHVFTFPDPWSIWFNVEALTVAGLAGTLLSVGAAVGRGTRIRRDALVGWLGVGVLVLGAGWYLVTAGIQRSHGATGSDPYCYAQMTVDLVERGSVLHPFPLAEVAQQAGLPTWPTAHVGYHPPAADTRAATVWPVGWSVLMVPFYLLGGEAGLLWAAPLFALLAGLWTYRLAPLLWPRLPVGEARLVGGLAALLTWTSYETVLRALVPMADAAAQACAVGLLLCLALARQRDDLRWSGLAGASLALAYLVRHPLLPLGLAALPLFALAPWPKRRKAYHLAALSGAALLGAIPDLLYHARVFGSPLATESPEWFLMSWRNIGPGLLSMLRDGLLHPNEFGYLLPFVLYGLWRSGRDAEDKGLAGALLVGFLATLLFALSYQALRLRDLLALFPWLSLWAAYGLWEVWQRARALSAAQVGPRALALFLIVLALSARTVDTLGVPLRPPIWTFGYISAAQRPEYDRLAAALPPGAIVATGLNSGAVERYTGHQTARPFSWTDAEWQQFAEAVSRAGRSLYLLDDGQEIELFLPRLESSMTSRFVGAYAIPTFGLGGQDYGKPAALYEVESAP